MQHDGPLAKCTASGRQPLMQERVELGSFGSCKQHNLIERFVIDIHALHNAHRLRGALDRSLVTPIPLNLPETQKAKHAEMAQNLRATYSQGGSTRRTEEQTDFETDSNTNHDHPSGTEEANEIGYGGGKW